MDKEDKREIVPVLKQGSYVRVMNLRECSLDTLRNRNLISPIQYSAGLKYRKLFEISQIGAKTANLSERIDSTGKGDIADHKLDAMQELVRCNTAVGPTSARVLDLVCGEGYTISDLNRIMEWSKYYGGHRLREALGEAAYHFGLQNKGNTIRG
jgi:hypothetical protein|tara:strand:+ start:2453 stop:2914 length:462 start_codon:yes stop_codon:yes gene_type:complete